MAMIQLDMPFQKTKAEYLIAIARSGVCQIPATSGNLPISVNTLYELSRLDENVLEAAVKDGRVHIDMTLAEAKKLANPETLRRDLQVRKKSEGKSPGPAAAPPAAADPADVDYKIAAGPSSPNPWPVAGAPIARTNVDRRPTLGAKWR